MATKSKTRKKASKSKPKKSASKKLSPKTAAKTLARTRATKAGAKKKSVKKPGAKKLSAKRQSTDALSAKKKQVPVKKQVRTKNRGSSPAFQRERSEPRSGELAGDLQGLPYRESADSESVDELLEEGNAFEADAVIGVENADADEGEVHTHEVPEDDVPQEYLDEE